jgi:hypothetical protein
MKRRILKAGVRSQEPGARRIRLKTEIRSLNKREQNL